MAHSRNDIIRENIEAEVGHNAESGVVDGVNRFVMQEEAIVDLAMSHIDPLVTEIAEPEKKLKELENLVEYAEDEADLGCDHYYDPVVPTSKLKHLI